MNTLCKKVHVSILKLFLLTLLAETLFYSNLLGATEIDSYTHTYLLREDSTDVINKKINLLLGQAVSKANQKKCIDPEELYHIINEVLGGVFITNLEDALEKSNSHCILTININESIYAGFSALWAPSIALSKRIGGVFRIQDSIIGTDKLGHFISQGYTYFEKCYLKREGVEKALLYGINSELTYYGFYVTGIFSFGDLVADFQGMRFWNDLLGKYPDILDEPESPFVIYEKGKWILNRPVDMRRYFDFGWDERVNKNLFRNPEIEAEVKRRIARTGVSNILPASQIEDSLKKRYKNYSVYVLNFGKTPVEFVDSMRRELKLAMKRRLIASNYNSDS